MKECTISVRVPRELRDALEERRRHMTKAAGAEVRYSAVLRAILEENLRPKKKKASASATRA